EACEIKPTWNAAVCRGDFGRISIGGVGGPGGPGGTGGPGGPGGPGALAGPGGPGGPGATPGAGGAPGAAAGAPPRPAPQPPITLSRNGRKMDYSGETTIRSGAEVKVETARPAVSLSLREMDSGSSVIFELPGFATAAAGTKQNSLAS